MNGGGTFKQQEEQEPNKKEPYAEDLHGGTTGRINGGVEGEDGGRAESSASAISKTAETEGKGAASPKKTIQQRARRTSATDGPERAQAGAIPHFWMPSHKGLHQV